MSTTDNILGRPAVADEGLVRSLFHEHGNNMLAYARKLTGDHAAAEDVVQEAMIRAWQHAASLNRGTDRGWLLTVVRNLVRDKARARAVRPREVAEPAPDTATCRDHAQHVVDSIVVGRAMRLLSPEHRQILEQLYFLGSTGPEAAQALGIPVGTVKSRSHHAIRLMRLILQG